MEDICLYSQQSLTCICITDIRAVGLASIKMGSWLFSQICKCRTTLARAALFHKNLKSIEENLMDYSAFDTYVKTITDSYFFYYASKSFLE